MNKLLLTSLFVLASGSALAQSTASSSGRDDPTYASYRRVVLGNSSDAMPALAEAAHESGLWVPGPYARYLIQVNGMSTTEALARAQSIGESPTFVANDARRPARQFSSYQQYQRVVLGRSDADIDASGAALARREADAGLASTHAN